MTDDPVSKQRAEEPRAADTLEAVEEFCHEMIERMRLKLDVSGICEGRIVTLNLAGPDRAMLLSGTAAALNSMEYLMNKVFQTGKDEEIATIILDSEKYRQHRESELKLLAQIASRKVLDQRRPLNLQPMNPRERRIVHMALAEVAGVRSQSEGEGDQRSITIYPA